MMSPPEKSRRTVSSKVSEQVNPFDPHMSGAMMGTLGEAGNAYLRGVVSLNREIASFISKRLEHDAELSRQLGKCKDWKEATEIQQHWVREASEEYVANARTLMELTTRIMNDTFAQIQSHQGDGSEPDEN